jgi:RNA methyltransferase, TrmH family
MPVRVIESKQNARLKELRRALAPGRQKMTGLVGIEGPHLVEEALRANLKIVCVFAGDGMQHWVRQLPLPADTEVLIVLKGVLASILSTETPQPIAALVEPPEWSWAHLLGQHNKKTLVVVLAGIQDPGNLGTIVRSAEAFGATGIVSLPRTVSAWNPKAVRASAGSVFRVPLLTASERICLERLREAGVRILATTVRAAQPADLVDMSGSVALVIGNEGNGVADDLVAKADAKITIPCPGPVESLNAAMAATVLLYEAARQRSAVSLSGIPPNSSKGRRAAGVPHAVGHRGARR